jgi:hypothetical protein
MEMVMICPQTHTGHILAVVLSAETIATKAGTRYMDFCLSFIDISVNDIYRSIYGTYRYLDLIWSIAGSIIVL